MKNLSIRTRILAGVVLVNLLGILVTMTYLHQSYSASVEAEAARAVRLSAAAFEQLQAASGEQLDPTTDQAGVAQLIGRMSEVTGSSYGFLLDKGSVDEQQYATLRMASNLPNNWSEGENSAMLAATDDAAAEAIRFNVPAGDVPESGKTVGVENGACSETCHNGITAEGDYWAVAWSKDRKSRAHYVFPVNNEAGQAVGIVYAIADISAQADEARVAMMRTLWVIVITLLVATLLIGYMVDAWVFRRMNRMMLAIQDVSTRVAGGDFDAAFTPDSSTDEIGRFEQFFANVLGLMTGTIKTLVDRK